MSTEDQPANASTTPPISPRGAARRRLTKAGLGAAGVLWSLDSRATMGPMVCFSPSAGYSGKLGKLSSNYNKNVTCNGKPPEYWDHSSWPCPKSRKFSSVFPCSSHNQSTYGSKTLLEIVKGCSFDNTGLAKELVAAYLNVLSGRITFLSVKTITDMWRQLQQGHYKPAPNAYWTAAQTTAYLKLTHYPSSYYS